LISLLCFRPFDFFLFTLFRLCGPRRFFFDAINTSSENVNRQRGYVNADLDLRMCVLTRRASFEEKTAGNKNGDTVVFEAERLAITPPRHLLARNGSLEELLESLPRPLQGRQTRDHAD
jgi:hypothetical protein